jgi:hypothetical protein
MTAKTEPRARTTSEERALTALVLADVFLGVLSLALDRTLPTGAAGPGGDASTAGTGVGSPLFWAWIAMVATTVLGWLGLVYLIRAGRALYLASWLAYLALAFATGGAVSPPVRVVQLLSALAGGAILAVAWLSPLRARFRSLKTALGREPADTK